MANYQLLKADIDEKVYQNGHQEITGENLNFVLNQMVTTLGAEYQFAGVATKDTNPGTPDAKVFYIANGKGKYTNFGGLEVTEDEVVVLYWDTAWHKEATGIASQAKLTELGQEVYPKVLAEYNGYINPDTGVPVSNAYWRYSDLFVVYPGLEITVFNRIDASQLVIAYYDAGKNYLKDISPKDSEAILSEYKERKVIVPDGVSFARFHSAYNVDTVAFALPYDGKNKDAMAAIQVSEYLVEQTNEKLNETNEKVTSIDERTTIIPKQNGYINTDTGDIVSTSYWRYSDLFPVTPGTTLKIHSRTNTGLVLLAFYDQYGGYLKDISPRSSSSGSSYEDNNIVVPAVAAFARFHSAYNMDAVATCVIDGVSIPENSVPSIQPKDWYNYKTVLPVPFELKGKKIVFFGDSITYGVASCEPSEQYPYGLINPCENPYAKLLCEKLGLDYTRATNNKAISGSRFAGEVNGIQSITDTILAFSESADIIYIAGGTNDYATKAAIGGVADTTQATLYGALNSICTYLKSNYPNAIVIFALPINWSKQLNYGVSIDAYREAIYEVAISNSYYVIDSSEIGFPKAMTDIGTPIFKADTIYDGIHPTELGHIVMANVLAKIMGGYSKDDTEYVEFGYNFQTELTQSTTNTSMLWVNTVIKNTRIDKIRFTAQQGTVNFYKVTAPNISKNASITKELIASVTNSQAEQGTIKEIDVSVILGENDYLGINGTFKYQASAGDNAFVALTDTDTIDTINSNIVLGYAGVSIISLADEIEELNKRVDNLRELPKNVVIVDKNGNGDYLNPFDAIVALKGKDTAANPYTILVMPGVYNMPTLPPDKFFSYSYYRHLSIIGYDKVNTILRNDKGYYNAAVSETGNLGDNTPLKLSGNIYIANLTIISTDSENAGNTDPLYHQSYCIHMDDSAYEGDIMEVHNCRLVNNHAPCIGFGIPKNATIKITDCELESDFWNPDAVYGGAVIYGHDRGGSTSVTEEHIIIKNCMFKSSNGHAFKSINNQNALMDCIFVGNACALPTGKGVVLGDTTTIIPPSFGNSIQEMNVNS